jgi:thioredoxin reductase (NADPH)
VTPAARGPEPVADLIVVGAGPTGVSAALWARSLGVSVAVLEGASEAGGQLAHVHFDLVNFAGGAPGDGPAIAARLGQQLADEKLDTRYGRAAERLEPATPAVVLAGGDRIAGRAVLIATGVRRRRLGVPGERELEGRGVSFSATKDRARFAGEDIVVAGGGDAAFQNALMLADAGCGVTLVVRSRVQARKEFQDRVAAATRIEVLRDTHVVAALGENRLNAVRLAGPRGEFELPAAGLVVKIGVDPNTEWCADALERDAEGYIPVDEHLGTSQARVWAGGDVTRPAVPGIAVALGHGALAAAAIRAVLREA